MVWVCVWCVVQNHCLGEISAQNAQIFDVMSEDTRTVILVQAMSTGKVMNMFKTFVSVNQISVWSATVKNYRPRNSLNTCGERILWQKPLDTGSTWCRLKEHHKIWRTFVIFMKENYWRSYYWAQFAGSWVYYHPSLAILDDLNALK